MKYIIVNNNQKEFNTDLLDYTIISGHKVKNKSKLKLIESQLDDRLYCEWSALNHIRNLNNVDTVEINYSDKIFEVPIGLCLSAPFSNGLNNLESYSRFHSLKDLQTVETIIQEKYPNLLKYWQQMLGLPVIYPCNMVSFNKPIFDEWHDFVFTVIQEILKRYNINNYEDLKKYINNNKNFYSKEFFKLEDQYNLVSFISQRISMAYYLALIERNNVFISDVINIKTN